MGAGRCLGEDGIEEGIDVVGIDFRSVDDFYLDGGDGGNGGGACIPHFEIGGGTSGWRREVLLHRFSQ